MPKAAGQPWYERVPKAELHLHLEGAIPLPALWQLIQKYGGDSTVPDITALERKFKFRDFPHFIETWVWKNRFLREYDDFTFFSEAVARDLAHQNIHYAEVFFSPSEFFYHGLQTQKITEAIRTGLNRVQQIKIALIMDLVRDRQPEVAVRNLDEASELKQLDVIGIGIEGSEHNYPPEPFAEIYLKARKLGLHTTAHAGEAAGPASIWGAIRSLKVERIGHGTRAIEDPVLMEYLAKTQIPLECCPLSNVRTGVVKSIEVHPIKKFYDAGLLVTVNSDDPKMFGNSLAEEYQMLEEKLSFTRNEIRELILNGIRASWLPQERKQAMIDEFVKDKNWQE